MKKQSTTLGQYFRNLCAQIMRSDADSAIAMVADEKPSLKNRLAKHLVTGAAAVAIAAGASSDAKASVVYWNYNRPISANVDGLYVNVESGVTYDSANANVVFPGWDINPYGTSTSAISFFWSGSSNGASAGVRLNTIAGGTTSGTTIASLPIGFVVGSQLVGGTSGASFGTGSATFSGTSQGKWNYNSDNYFGFRFTASDGLIHYGWGRIYVGANASIRTMLSVAYETVAGDPITVGVGDPTPACTNPTLSATTIATTCAGQLDGSIDLTVSGGSPTPYSYSWTAAGSATVIATTEDISGKAAGNYVVKVMTASGGCYTLGNYTISAGPAPTTNTTPISACDSYTWSVDGNIYTQSGNYTSVSGCASEILNLTISPSTTNTTTATEASSYTWSVNSQTYTQSGTYTSVSGCATEILNLTISGACPPTTPPTVACYETATWNTTTCQYDITGTQPSQPSLACYESATFNTTTCQWDITGTQPAAPTGLACYETANFNTTTCSWDVTGSQPAMPGSAVNINVTYTGGCGFLSGTYTNSGLLNGYYDFQYNTNGFTYHISYSGTEWVLWVIDYTNNGFMSSSSASNGLYPPTTGWTPTQCFDGSLSWTFASPLLACYQTANFNTNTCSWDITGTQPSQPTLACYESATFNDSTCQWVVTGTQPSQPTLACYESANFNTTTCSWDVTGTQPSQPSLACYESANFNTTTCSWDVTGTQPSQPTLACYESANFNTTTCSWDVTGTQPTQPTLACYESANFDTGTCQWNVTGTQPSLPTLACYESANFNTSTCSWDVTGTQPAAPTGLACYETANFNTTTCSWDVTGTQPAAPGTAVNINVTYTGGCGFLSGTYTNSGLLNGYYDFQYNTNGFTYHISYSGTEWVLWVYDYTNNGFMSSSSASNGLYPPTTGWTPTQCFDGTLSWSFASPLLACYQTANFNTTTCSWDITGTQPTQPTLACYESASFNDSTCQWVVTGTQPSQPTLACYESANFNTTTCSWDVTGTQPSQPTLACYESANFNTSTCSWDVTGTQPAQPTLSCWSIATFNNTTCQWDISGSQPSVPTLACYETATFNNTTCQWDVAGTQPSQPTLACYESANFNTSTCSWDVTGTQPQQPTLACYESANFDTGTCQWNVTGTQPSLPTLACYETATFNGTTCQWDVTGTQPSQPSLACYESANFNTTTCQWDVTGTQPSQPTGLACYQIATFNTTSCQWDVTGSPLSASASTNGFACNSTTSNITVTASGGNLPYSGTGVFARTSGNYTFTVTDAGGCSATATVSNIDTIAPTITNVPSNFTATISCSGPVSWTAPSANDNCSVTSFTSNKAPGDIFPVGTTTVVYTAVDAIGNTTTASFTVTVVSFAISTSGTNITCYGSNDGAASVNTINTQGSVSYLWSTGATTSSLSNLTAGNYTVIVTNGSCTQNGFIVITQPAQLNANVNKTDVTCNGGSNGSISITNPVGGSNNFEYSINGGTSWQLSGNYSGLAAGSYSVQIRDAFNKTCVRSLSTVTISQPSAFTVSINASPSTTVCQGTTVQLCASLSVSSTGFTYLWNNSATTSCINITNTGTNSYTVRATNSAGCSATSSPISVTVNPSVAASVSISSNISGPVSPSSSITFVATPVNGGTTPTYSWKRNGTIVGTNSNSYTGTSWTTGETVQCVMTSNAPCASGSPASSNTITITISSSQPKFIVSDVTANKVFYYDSTFAFIQSSPLSTNVLNGTTNAEDLCATSTNVYILDGTNKKVYRTSNAGAVSTVSRPLRSNTGTGLNQLTGIVLIGNKMILLDKNSKVIYVYDVTAAFTGTTNYSALQKISLNTSNSNAEAISYDAATNAIYVLDNGTTKTFFRYAITANTTSGITLGTSTRSRPMRTNTGLALNQVTGSVVNNTTLCVTDRGLDRALTYRISDLFTGSNTVTLNALSLANLNAQNLNSTGISIVSSTTTAREDVLVEQTPDVMQLNVYPNPASSLVNVLLTGLSDETTGTLEIMDMSGRKLFEKAAIGGNSSYQEEISLEGFSKGIYMVVYTQGEQRKSMRLIVQ